MSHPLRRETGMGSDNPTGADNQQETKRPSVQLDPMWLVGFVDGEGCFSVSVHRNPLVRRTRGWQLQAAFQVYQHERYRTVLEAMVAFFGCGAIRSKGPASSVLTYTVWALADLEEKVVPFFEHHPLVVKAHDFQRFADIVRSMRRKEHLTAGRVRTDRALRVRHEPSWQATSTDTRGSPRRILRDCTPSARDLPVSGEGTVRPPWRHGEPGRNDLAPLFQENERE